MLRMEDCYIGTTVLIADMGNSLVVGESLWNHGLLYNPDANEFYVWGTKKVYKISPSDWSVGFAAQSGAHPSDMGAQEF